MPRSASPPGLLPYTDTKPQGAADFYFAINATFRFIHNRFGPGGWATYLRQMGEGYFEPVNAAWRSGGLMAVASYWQAFFAAEPGAEVEVFRDATTVTVEVRRCPAIAHLRSGDREIVPFFCEHCFHLGSARANASGFAMRLEGGAGQCRQTFCSSSEVPPQDMSAIRKVEPLC